MKRSFITTIALIAAIAVQLCASSGWARGLGVLALGGGPVTTAPEWPIEDDFSSDCSGTGCTSYTRISGTGEISVAGGVAKTASYNLAAWYQHITDLGSANQTVRGILCDGSGNNNRSGFLLRSNGTTGHGCYIDSSNGRAECEAIGGSGTAIYINTGHVWSNGSCHLVEISVNSSNQYSVKMDLNDDLDFLDTGESPPAVTNDSYAGTRVGIGWRYTAVANDVYVDDFKAKAIP